MHCTSVCLVLAMCLVSVFGAGTAVVKLLEGPTDPTNCWKYCVHGKDNLQITHLRVLFLDKRPEYKGKIFRNVLCSFTDPNKPANCQETGSTQTDYDIAIMISVTAKENKNDPKPLMLSQVEYRYNEKTMQLFKNGLLTASRLANAEFKHDTHIQVKEISIRGINGLPDIDAKFGGCHEAAAYPGALIADHGLYVIKYDPKSKDISWKRMYFDPDGLAERVVTETD